MNNASDPIREPIDPRDDVFGLTEGYVHGLLSSEQARHVDDQVARDVVWRAALEQARARDRAMKALPPREPSDALLALAFDVAKARGTRALRVRRGIWISIPGAFAAAALVLLLLQVYFTNLSPSGYDLSVLAQTTLASGSPASMRVRLFNRSSDAPVEGAPVEVLLSSPKGPSVVLARFTTDSRGTGSPRYTVPDWNDGDYTLRITANGRAGTETIDRTVTLKRTGRLMLSTDKPVYQPGQTILMRALALKRADGKPIAGQEAVFTIADPKGTIIFKKRAVTSGFGITSAECPLATEILHGTYTLTCTVGGGGGLGGTESKRDVEVRPYQLPKFKVVLDVAEPYLRPGQLVRATVTAGYFFGQPVAGGTAEIVFATEGGDTRRETVSLDPQGIGRAEFRVPDRLIGTQHDGGDARVALTATVTDSAGQSESKKVTRVVASRELRIEMIPESGTLIPGVLNRVYVLVTTPDGRPAPNARLAISGVEVELTTSELGVAVFDLTPPKPGKGPGNAPGTASGPGSDIALIVSATDAAGRSTQQSVKLSTRVISGDFLFRTDAAVYRAGGTVTVDVRGGGIDPVYIDLLKEGQTILTQVVDIKSGAGQLAIDIPADLSGTFELVAYRFGADGMLARRARTIVVEAAGDLNVALTTDKPTYRPGERAKLSLAVTGAGNAPAPGAVSIAGVDEAVYSVLSEAPGMERTLLTLDEQLLKPVYTIYPWASRANPTPSQRELDKALFSATAIERLSDRKAIFQRLIDQGSISEELLDALESPRAEWLIDDLLASGSISAEAAAILRGKANDTHTLMGTTWPEKVQRTAAVRHQAVAAIQLGWGVLVAIAIGTAFVLVCIFVKGAFGAIVTAILFGGLLIGMMLPTLGKARQSARQIRDSTSLRNIGMALDLDADGRRSAAPSASGSAPRLREWFPETLFWRPEIITDDAGRATIDVDLADSITTWRLTGSAITRDGRLGSLDGQLAVFQPFFVDINAPLSLTRGDEIAIPLAVYNYLDSPQTVTLTVAREPGFELLSPASQTVALAANAVHTASIRVRATRAGSIDLQVTATTNAPVAPGAAPVADAIRRTIDVRPGGRPIEQLVTGSLASPLAADFTLPADAIEGSGQLFVKIYPSPLSQFVEGLDGIFVAPHGCFEQTSSTTYPSVLALWYLKQTGKAVPAVDAKARQYIHMGYQRLLSFEVDGGGFSWFGRSPANRLLTAYGLMEFVDMAKVHDVDPALIDRTRRWLLAQRRSDGSWGYENHAPESAPSPRSMKDAEVLTTAYIAWAVFGDANTADAAPTRNYLRAVRPESIDDPYLLALLVHALAAVGADEQPALRRLIELREQSTDGKQVYWSRAVGTRTAFYGSGRSGGIETTALATLALLKHRAEPTMVRAALEYLTSNRDSGGTWGTTQATVLALKALVKAADAPLGEAAERAITLELDGRAAQRVTLAPDQAEVLKQLDLSAFLTPGTHRVTLRQSAGPAAQAQVLFRAAVPSQPPGATETSRSESVLAVSVTYDRDALRVGQELRARAALSTNTTNPVPMVMLDLPIPAGFDVRRADFDGLMNAGAIARYEVTPRTVIVYLTTLDKTRPLTLEYAMRATMPVSVRVDGPAAYEYYNPDRKARGSGASVWVD